MAPKTERRSRTSFGSGGSVSSGDAFEDVERTEGGAENRGSGEVGAWLRKTHDEDQKSEFSTVEREANALNVIQSQIDEHKLSLSHLQEMVHRQEEQLNTVDSDIGDVKQRVSSLQSEVESMGSETQHQTPNLESADLIYRSVVATGAVLSLLGAVITFAAFELITVAALLVGVAVFLGYTTRRGLKPINVS